MSYDLFLKPRDNVFDRATLDRYFAHRPNYKVQGTQAWYQNEETGVYFVFEFGEPSTDESDEPAPSYPVSLNINYFRPTCFIFEAEPEITTFVRAFDMVVSDPQSHGMGEGDYQADKLKAGWLYGNEFAYSAILRDPKNRPGVRALPTEQLLRAWQWNLNRNLLQSQLGESRFVPRVMFLMVDGRPATAATWPDGIPIAVPEVDYFLVPRRDLAPRRFFRRMPDHTLVSYQSALPTLERHRAKGLHILVLDYDGPPKDVVAYVQALPPLASEIQGVPADQMLNQELVDRAMGAGAT